MPLLWSWGKSISFHLYQLIICSIPQILQFPSPPFLPAGRQERGRVNGCVFEKIVHLISCLTSLIFNSYFLFLISVLNGI
jgi:hypothetical protein